MLDKIILDKIEYNILYSPIINKDDVKLHKPLITALWNKLSDEVKQKLIIKNPYNDKHKILNFDKILECYVFDGNETVKYAHLMVNSFFEKGTYYNDLKDKYKLFDNKKCGCCACGVKIEHKFIIKNISTNTFFIIGSECIKWWKYKKVIRNTKEIIKAMLEKKEIPQFCPFCKSSRSCINCKEKQLLKNIITKWRTYSKMKLNDAVSDLTTKVNFGKYKGQTYYKLCQDHNYLSYILNNDFDQRTKSKVIKYIKYRLLFKKPKYQELLTK